MSRSRLGKIENYREVNSGGEIKMTVSNQVHMLNFSRSGLKFGVGMVSD